MQDAVEMTAGEGGKRPRDLLARTDDLQTRLLGERVAELLEPFAGARQVDADVVVGDFAHRDPLPVPNTSWSIWP